jgi:REP element-mobilizing transposase RayT
MSTYTQIIYQLVFCTKNRERVLLKEGRKDLFIYITGLIKNKRCHLYQINGVEDHIHILTEIHPSISLAGLVKDIKVASSLYIKEQKLFKNFTCWQPGYGAFTYNVRDKNRLIEYVKNQEEHHKKKCLRKEYIQLLNENRIQYDEKYLF